jgi:hypothetical protein
MRTIRLIEDTARKNPNYDDYSYLVTNGATTDKIVLVFLNGCALFGNHNDIHYDWEIIDNYTIGIKCKIRPYDVVFALIND